MSKIGILLFITYIYTISPNDKFKFRLTMSYISLLWAQYVRLSSLLVYQYV